MASVMAVLEPMFIELLWINSVAIESNVKLNFMPVAFQYKYTILRV